jgi:hypothetical protein
MASSTRKKPVVRMALFGVIAAALYVILLTQQVFIIKCFGQGGWYAFLPIGTAFLFSFVHGNFTGSFWTVVGVEASKKKVEVK